MSSAFIPTDYFRRLKTEEIFEDSRPFEVDLGCGDGGFLFQMAEHYPERHFLAIERLLGRVRKVCSKSDRIYGLNNVKVFRVESLYAVQWLLPYNSVSRLHLLCPDPWPKIKHHRRRLVQQEFLDALHQVLIPEGEFLFKTDHEEYFDWVLEQVSAHAGFKRLEWEGEDFYYPKTDFQLLWESQGLKLQQVRFVRVS